MSKPSKPNSTNKNFKNDFHALLSGTAKPILEQWKSESESEPNPPWAPKPTHTQAFNETEIAYMAKIKALNEMSDYIYNRNLKLKYRLNAVAKEIKSLKRVKRVLCRRLFEHSSKELLGAYLEIPDSETSTVVMDQIIGDVVNTATQSKAAPTPLVKKKRKEQKPPQNATASPTNTNSNCSKEDEINQHIISVIDNVANTSYKSSNGPTQSKKPRKQNLAALTSPTKDTLIFTNGSSTSSPLSTSSLNNNTFNGQDSQPVAIKVEIPSPPTTYVAKQPSATFVTQNKDFTTPTHLPIYVKRELVCPPEKRENTTVVASNSGSIPAIYSVQSSSGNTFVASSNSSNNPQTPLTTNSKMDTLTHTTNGQNSVDTTNYLPSKQPNHAATVPNNLAASSSPSISLETSKEPNNSTTKPYYTTKICVRNIGNHSRKSKNAGSKQTQQQWQSDVGTK
ncbi:hypothetical protein M3Y97_00866400 [Aphelenchoides bicaudatus]|nr:hypothetical protein M3Y97_00866400 [Aphelenchoides bicaudatus]